MRTIKEDGSLDPAADFKDDGASFRVRRETQLHAQARRSMWSKPRNYKEAVSGGLKIVLLLTFVAVVVPGSFLVAAVIAWAFSR